MVVSSSFIRLLSLLTTLVSSTSAYETCIIGAGPAGIQLGHLLHDAGRDYRLFERHAHVASFFERFPVHRRLISLNQVHIGSNDPEFQMRFDWNSLLGNANVTPLTARTPDKWPHADDVVDYLRDFASSQVAGGHIQFNTTVRRVARQGTTFELHLEKGDRVSCSDVVVATGVGKPHTLDVGENEVFGYEHLPSVDAFEGMHVAVLGNGNAAFETVEWLGNHAYVTLLHRVRSLDWRARCDSEQKAEGTRMSMMTHYVGDVRAQRLGLFDAYNLKMRDRIVRIHSDDIPVVFKCLGTKKCIVSSEKGQPLTDTQVHFTYEGKDRAVVEEALEVYREANPAWADAVRIFGHPCNHSSYECEVNSQHPNHDLFREELLRQKVEPQRFENPEWFSSFEVSLRLDALVNDPHLLTFLAERIDVEPNPMKEPDSSEMVVVDAVIRCFGWHFDDTIFEPSLQPIPIYGGKFPQIDGLYQSSPGLFFAGALAHALDFRVAAGGFIHGYRYTARALFRLLEARHHKIPWFSKHFDNVEDDSGREALLRHLLYRMNHAAGPYQMLGGTLVDAIVFHGGGCKKTPLTATYLEEVPPQYLHSQYNNSIRVAWFFQYGQNSHGPHQLHADNVGAWQEWRAHESTFLHPKLERFSAGSVDAHSHHWMLEDLDFRFDRHRKHVIPLRAFLREGIFETLMCSASVESTQTCSDQQTR